MRKRVAITQLCYCEKLYEVSEALEGAVLIVPDGKTSADIEPLFQAWWDYRNEIMEHDECDEDSDDGGWDEFFQWLIKHHGFKRDKAIECVTVCDY